MKILYIGSFFLPKEHIFIQNVWLALKKKADAEFLKFSLTDDGEDSLTFDDEDRVWTLNIPVEWGNNQVIKDVLVSAFRKINPDIIHSNIAEGIDILAAKTVGIPIVNTIHVGGTICPRGQCDGFLKYDDSQCDQYVGPTCIKCLYHNIPAPGIARIVHSVIPNRLQSYLRRHLKKRVLYLSPVLDFNDSIKNRLDAINHIYKYTTFICANTRLEQLLHINGLANTEVIPHGIPQRRRLPLPDLDGKIKFYYVGRFHYSKGIHLMLEAFNDIPSDKYELHLVGDISKTSKTASRYLRKLEKLAVGKNVFFEGEIDNKDLDNVISQYHVMIHPAICHEVYGLAIAESLSMGRPVLATRCGGSEMQIEDDSNGWLVESNNIEALHDKIAYLIDNPDQILKCAQNAVTPHNLGDYIDALIDVYKSTISSYHKENV